MTKQALTEDTPEGGKDELLWRVEQLTNRLKQKEENCSALQEKIIAQRSKLNAVEERFKQLTDIMTVGALRQAGAIVTIELPEHPTWDYE
jgi:predicted  nucleic acid-binding Zn-ribbon protein